MQPVKKFPWMKQWLAVVRNSGEEDMFGQPIGLEVTVFPARVTYGDRLLASAFGVVGVFNMEAFTAEEAYGLARISYIQEASEYKPSAIFLKEDYNDSLGEAEIAIEDYIGALSAKVQPNRSSVRSDISQRRKYAYFSQTGG